MRTIWIRKVNIFLLYKEVQHTCMVSLHQIFELFKTNTCDLTILFLLRICSLSEKLYCNLEFCKVAVLIHSVIQGQSPPCLKEKKSSPPPNFSHPWVPRILIPPPQVKLFYRCYFQKLKTNFGPFGSLHFAKLCSTTNINIWNSLDLKNKTELLSSWIV